ncbi:unnamed protein product [Schistosoma mattheei]|uniref:Uncharacterized protein n=1 Tax=Schistosoma mattheei TaxID=31246 RepID=A0A183P3N4_9TREM|nr:unnamed protein product [Schistosoma mattheei]
MFSKVHLCLPVIVLEIFFICVQSYDFPESPYFSRYDGLDYSPDSFGHPHKRTRRSTSKTNILLPIKAFGKSFHLVLYPDYEVVHPNAKLVVGGREWTGGLPAVSDHVVRGYVDGFTHSVVFGSVIDGVFRGTVSLNKSNLLHSAPGSYDTYFIEPSGYYFNKDFPFHSVIYNSLDVKTPTVGQSRMRRAVQDMNFKNHEPYFPELQSQFVRSFKSPHLVTNNSLPYTDKGPNTRVCNLYLQSDTYLWDHVINKPHIQGNRELAVKEITSIFTQHVQAAQLIYQDAVFRDHSGRLEFRGVSFRVDRVLINVTEHDCRNRVWKPTYLQDRNNSYISPTALPRETFSDHLSLHQPSNTDHLSFSGAYTDENPFCAPNIDVTNYLNLHSYNKHDDFCLAYIFTYRDFSGGTIGLAWVAEVGGAGGVCEKHRRMQEGDQSVYKSLNTGVVTLLNYGSKVATKVSQLTFAHELGHNFGAKHDNFHENESHGCLPSIDDVRGNYIMFASAISGDKENNNKFSSCSLDSIAKLLDRVLRGERNCFLTSDGPFCGNQLTEEGEECDCGFTRANCHDKCCHPRDSTSPCKLVNSVFIDHTERTDGTRVCKQGQCIGSICERIPGWHECSFTRDKKVVPELMCFVGCKQNISGAPCISSFQLEKVSFPHPFAWIHNMSNNGAVLLDLILDFPIQSNIFIHLFYSIFGLFLFSILIKPC